VAVDNCKRAWLFSDGVDNRLDPVDKVTAQEGKRRPAVEK
jgi:hypothetical protein